jgi:hypothetical protein
MLQIVIVGLVAGLAAALLFLAPISGAAIAFPLFILSGLPVAIGGLGWGVAGGAIAALAGGAGISIVVSALGGAVYILLFGAPIAWVARLALLSRPMDQDEPDGERQWYPLGRLLFHAAIVSAIGLVLVGFAIGFDPDTLVNEMTTTLVEWLAASQSAVGPAPTAEEIQPFVQLNVAAMPFTIGAFLLAIIILNLWIGALVARASGRFERPHEKLWTAVLPNGAVAGFAVALMLSFLPGALGDVAGVFTGALGLALVLIGLAVMHVFTLGMAARGFLLAIAYVLTFLFGLPIILFALIGISESFLHLRARRLSGNPPPV